MKCNLMTLSAILVLTVLPIEGNTQSRRDSCNQLETTQRTQVLLDCIREQSDRINFLEQTLDKFQFMVFDIEDRIRSVPALPSGAVVAFGESIRCPEGWREYRQAAGRTIIGVGRGNTDARGDFLTQRELFDVGGVEQVTLEPSQIPEHSHVFDLNQRKGSGNGSVTFGRIASDGVPTTDSGETSVSGAGNSHENMPPFLALQYCIKD